MTEIEVYEHEEEPGELVVRGSELSVLPAVSAQDLVGRLDVIRSAMRDAMTPNVDYGVIPGTGGKPTLLKPGSEKLGVLFQLDIQIENEKIWDGQHLTVMSKAIAFHAPTGTRLGAGEGLCSTRETKYAYRKGERVCPACGEAQVREGKPSDRGPGNWYCWKKQGGCGATWALDSEQGKTFKATDVGKVENPGLPDTWNTVLKMSEKRARIDAVLAVTGASALFTQDIEDAPASSPREDAPPPAPKADVPVSWPEWLERMALLGVREPETWLAQACMARYGIDSIKGLKSGERTELMESVNAVYLTLVYAKLTAAEETLGFLEDDRVRHWFAEFFSGALLDGPADLPVVSEDVSEHETHEYVEEEIPFGD